MKKVITLLFTFLFILFNCPTETMDEPRIDPIFIDGIFFIAFYSNGIISSV